MYSYCNNNAVVFADPSGNLSLSSLFNAFKVSLKVSSMMLKQAVSGKGQKQSYGAKSVVSKALKKSTIMQAEVASNIQKHNSSGLKTSTYTGSVSLYGKDNKYDFDLSYSVGKASYSMTITTEENTTGFWFFRSTKTRTVTTVKVSDVYDFDEYREGLNLSNFMNNVGYSAQAIDVIVPFSWDAEYTVYGDWKKE